MAYNVVGITDDNGQVVASREYNAFGNIISETGDWSTIRFGFQPNWIEIKGSGGHLYSTPSGRIYDTRIGRFLQRDQVKGLAGGYGYANQNPLRYVDPLGLEEVPLCKKITAPESETPTGWAYAGMYPVVSQGTARHVRHWHKFAIRYCRAWISVYECCCDDKVAYSLGKKWECILKTVDLGADFIVVRTGDITSPWPPLPTSPVDLVTLAAELLAGEAQEILWEMGGEVSVLRDDAGQLQRIISARSPQENEEGRILWTEDPGCEDSLEL